jgi:serine/threonine-protein kinase
VLFAVPFDVERLETRGLATPVVQGVLGARSSGAAYFAISDNGSLAYLPGAVAGEERTIVSYDHQGKAETLPAPPRTYGDIVLSPDGRLAAFAVTDSKASDIWVYDLRRNTLNRLTFGPGMNNSPLWMPDGRHIVFLRDERNGQYSLCRKAADGSGAVEVLLDSPVPLYPDSASPDGKQLTVSSSPSTQNASDISLLSVADRKLGPFVETSADEYNSEISPDGRWISYQSSETGRYEVYVRPASGAGGRWQISSGGGDEARWSPNGKEIFFRAGLQLMVVPVDTKDGFHVGTPRKVLDSFPSLGGTGSGSGRTYAVSRDGKHFYSVRSSLAGVSSALVVVVNWAEELRALTSPGKQ